jgi:hypothetical protein
MHGRRGGNLLESDSIAEPKPVVGGGSAGQEESNMDEAESYFGVIMVGVVASVMTLAWREKSQPVGMCLLANQALRQPI